MHWVIALHNPKLGAASDAAATSFYARPVVLRRTNASVAYCLERAEAARRSTARAMREADRRRYQEMECRWLKLAESDQVSGRGTAYLAHIAASQAQEFCMFCGESLILKKVDCVPSWPSH